MPRINLLPWREGQRKERKLAFLVALGVAAIAAGVVSFAGYLMFGSMIDQQQHRNERLRAEIKRLDKQIEEINSLETAKQKFIARMEIIEKLQRSRPEIVHVFDEIVSTLPDGAYLTAIKQTDQKLKFDGVAQSSTRVSAFMRNIDASQWLRNPELEVVQTSKGSGPGSSFTLFADQVSTEAPDEPTGGRPKRQLRKASAGTRSAAMNILEELRSLDSRDPGRWPLAIRIGAVGIAFLVLSAVGIYFLVWDEQRPRLQQFAAEEQKLRQEFRDKHAKAVNLSSTSSSWPTSSAPSAPCCASCPAAPRCRTCWWTSRRPASRRASRRSCSSRGLRSGRTSTPSCRSRSASPAAITSSASSSAASRRCRAS